MAIVENRLEDPAADSLTADRPALEVSVVLPCLNEARTVGKCVKKAIDVMAHAGISGEVIVADNGSTDGSQKIAQQAGARVVLVDRKGYGSALLGGISVAHGKYVVMGDADDSYDFAHIPRLLEKLRAGYQLVIGNRFKGGIQPGAMPPLHRYLGNPVLSGIGRLFFRCGIGDFHCGLRGFEKQAVEALDLHASGMEFASEMVVKATLHELRVCEVPTTLSPDGRNRAPHLRSWRDGWRHLRFMLLFSPRWLFFYPGVALMVIGALTMIWLLPGPQRLIGISFDVHSLLYATAAILIGFQAVLFSLLGKLFAMTTGLMPYTRLWRRISRWVILETGLCVGAVSALAGLAVSLWAVAYWGNAHFGPLDARFFLRLVIPAVLLLVLGCQIIMASFFISILRLAWPDGQERS